MALGQAAVLLKSTLMASSKNNPRPSFFWQGLMIVLPVTVLAVVGLFSLRQDEQAAEQAARKKAAENVASRRSVQELLLPANGLGANV